MNPDRAFCPQCKNDVVFQAVGLRRKCPMCGFQFEVAGTGPPIESKFWPEVMSVVEVLVRVFLIMIAVVAVGLGLLFVGCSLMLR